ncbi:hypothetical protein CDN99_20905 [Roseateles aquatilis]|uniref:Glycine zipper family protein n=1 Tax=Roseateles aquatilis TaxID=431061 RepID=A0A246J299_9BURK|nr:DUF6515 family protein [Roseateles aquatilis]OWQ86294.1 hypothetical protein CDN99_20905 [Roseateles aquatilis]
MNKLRWLIPVVLALGSGLASAQHHGGPGPRAEIGLHFDARYHHDHYYPSPGYVSRGLPSGAMFVGNRYWYHGGVWYQPWGPSYRVILPPIGFVVPILPSAYVSLRIGGLPYYYANGAYYAVASPGPGYVVVAPPPGADAAQPAPVAPPRPDPIIYPRNGQSPEQTEADRQTCNRWATTQPSAMNDAGIFNRAVEACMDGRGYSMR